MSKDEIKKILNLKSLPKQKKKNSNKKEWISNLKEKNK
jgi:hypothetical protein